MGLLLAFTQQLLLGVDDHTNGLAVLLDLVKIFLDFFLANIVLPFQAGLSEGLLLGLGPLFPRKDEN